MLARTHFVFGLLFGVIFLPLLKFGGLVDYFIYFLFIQLGVLFPDLDHPKAKIHRKIFVSKIIPLVVSHRGFFHSLFPPVIISSTLFYFLKEFYALPFFVGYFSHLLGDALTVQGIAFFQPFSNFKIHGLLVTGSFTEKIIFYAITILILFRIYYLF